MVFVTITALILVLKTEAVTNDPFTHRVGAGKITGKVTEFKNEMEKLLLYF